MAESPGAGKAINRAGDLGRVILRCREADVAVVGSSVGIDLPEVACRSSERDELAALWLGPDEWLLLHSAPPEGWIEDIRDRLTEVSHSLVDVGHRQVGLTVGGAHAEAILAAGCPLDLSPVAFPVSMCTRTLLGKAEIVLWRTAADRFHLEVWRSFRPYVETLLRQADLEQNGVAEDEPLMTEEELYADFQEAGIAVEKLEHEPVHTVEESAAIHSALTAGHTKNLFLKDKRGAFWLVVLPSDRRADLKQVAEAVGAGKFSFGKADDLERLLHIKPGAVTPLAAVNAPTGEVQVVIDSSFRSSSTLR